MFARTLALSTSLLLMSATCQAQDLLNPFTWFNPGYNQPYGNCPNGNCAPTSTYRGYPTANCPNGNCGVAGYPTAACPNGNCNLTTGYRGYPTANCPNGVCPLPNTGYSAYRPAPVQPTYYSAQPYRGNNVPVVTNPNAYRYPAPINQAQVAPSRGYNNANSPFYP